MSLFRPEGGANMKQIFFILVLLFFARTAFAQDDGPVIAVQAPTSVTAGQIVWIKTEGTIADDLAWRTQAPAHSWNLADDKRSAMFQTVDGDRDYLFVIAACRNNKIDIKFFVIKVTGGCTPSPNPPQPGPDVPSPGPNPSPNPSPTPSTDFSRTVKRLAEENLPSSERSRCKSLSESIESLCSRIMATQSDWSPRSAREAFRRNNATALGAAAGQWGVFSDRLSGEIGRIMPTTITVADQVDVWRQVASGLRDVQ